MAGCSRVRKVLPSYLEGTLSADEASSVELHLSGCPACRRRLDALRRVEQASGGLRAVVTPAGAVEKLEAAVLSKAQESDARTFRWPTLTRRPSLPRWRRPVTATAAIVILAVTLFVWQSFEGLIRLTWAEVRETLHTAPWVHYVLRDPETREVIAERWYDTSRSRHYLRSECKVPHLVLTDYKSGEEWLYYPGEGTIAIFRLQDEWEPETNFFLDALASENRTEIRAEGANGLIRFDIFRAQEDKTGDRALSARVWVDSVVRLPVRVVLYAPGEDGRKQAKMSESTISYPPTGPADVFALGIPRDVKIVKIDGACPISGEYVPAWQRNP